MYDPAKPYKQKILELIKKTWETPYVSIKGDIYPIIERQFSYPEIDHTDGIGTKGIYHWQQRTFKNASLDVLAMNLNDLVLARARPYKLQNHILIPQDDREAILEILGTLVEECRKRKIAITGGETSIHDNLDGLEISINISGFIKVYKQNKFEAGDVLIGIGSSGLHSNGFTKVREVFNKEYKPEFVEPTHIYQDAILTLDEQFDIHGMMHITGGAYTKLRDLLPNNNTEARIKRGHKLQPQQIFRDLHEKGVSDEEMYKIFNCGVGFVLSSSPQEAEKIVSQLDADGFKTEVIGEITSGIGQIRIESMFSNKEIKF